MSVSLAPGYWNTCPVRYDVAARGELIEAAEHYVRLVDVFDALETGVFLLTRVGTPPPASLEDRYLSAEGVLAECGGRC